MDMKNTLDGKSLTIQKIYQWSQTPGLQLSLTEDSVKKVKASRAYIEKRISAGDIMYGVNTGFGAFASTTISNKDIEQLQKNLIRSHCAGIGEPLSIEQSRAAMILRANTLAQGHSGVRVEVLEKIFELLQKDLIPKIPCQGSVGASGDLAPLAHLALALIGEGEFWDAQGKSFEPLQLKAKEGLALINGCQIMTAIGIISAYQAKHLALLADISAATTIEGLRGSRSAFDPLIAAVRPHDGENQTAFNLRKILGEKSEISESHKDCHRVQDPYSLRCTPAVHGAVKRNLKSILQTLEIEANSSTDNPLVFADENKILSCGNFHGEPVAMALDLGKIALSVLANISECRISKLIHPNFSELPAFLAADGGLQSGLMIVQVAAASLVSENKILSHPACVDSIPTSTDKEDHVSMGTIASRQFTQILRNAEYVIAMEFLAAAQALDFLKPLKPTAGVQKVYEQIRNVVSFADQDRVFAKDIQAILQLIKTEKFLSEIETVTGELQW